MVWVPQRTQDTGGGVDGVGPPKDPGHWRSGWCRSPKRPRALEEEWVVWVPQRPRALEEEWVVWVPKRPRAREEE